MELAPLHSEPVLMATKPACSVTFYSNARQAAVRERNIEREREREREREINHVHYRYN